MLANARNATKDSTVATSRIEDQFIANCQRGEKSSFEPLVEEYGDVVFGTVLLMTRDRALAEDLTQETFLLAWRGIKTFRLGAPFRPWLLRIAVNRVKSWRRRRWLNIIPLADSAESTSEPGPDSAFEQQWEHERVRQAIAQLTADEQRVLVLRYFSELTVPEIASTLRCPAGTVKSRLHRAHGAMRERLHAEITRA